MSITGDTKQQHRSKICYVAPDVAIPSPRGSSVHVLELSKGLAQHGHEVHVVCRRMRRADPALEVIEGITLHRVYRWIVRPEYKSSLSGDSTWARDSTMTNSLYHIYLLTIFRIYVAIVVSRICRKNQIETILERETSFGAGGIASLLTGKTLVLEIIGPRYSRLSVSRCIHIFYYTDSMLRGWVDKRKCVPVPAGVNLDVFYPDDEKGALLRDRIGLEQQAIVIGYVGTFQNWHGIDDFLKATAILRNSYPSVRLLLVGAGFERYFERANELGISQSCIFTGGVAYRNVPDYIDACDIMVAPYNPRVDPLRRRYGIGWPLKILEYMACAKPVISTKVKPIDEIISDESLGILVPPGDPQRLSDAIKELLSNPQERIEMGKEGFLLVQAKYSWMAVARFISGYV